MGPSSIRSYNGSHAGSVAKLKNLKVVELSQPPSESGPRRHNMTEFVGKLEPNGNPTPHKSYTPVRKPLNNVASK